MKIYTDDFWKNIDWTKRNGIIANKIGCSYHTVFVNRRKFTKIHYGRGSGRKISIEEYKSKFPLLLENNLSLAEYGRIYKITRERVRQLIKLFGLPPKREIFKDKLSKIIKASDFARTDGFIVKKYGLSWCAVKNYRKSLGIRPGKLLKKTPAEKFDKYKSKYPLLFDKKFKIVECAKIYNVRASSLYSIASKFKFRRFTARKKNLRTRL